MIIIIAHIVSARKISRIVLYCRDQVRKMSVLICKETAICQHWGARLVVACSHV